MSASHYNTIILFESLLEHYLFSFNLHAYSLETKNFHQNLQFLYYFSLYTCFVWMEFTATFGFTSYNALHGNNKNIMQGIYFYTRFQSNLFVLCFEASIKTPLCFVELDITICMWWHARYIYVSNEESNSTRQWYLKGGEEYHSLTMMKMCVRYKFMLWKENRKLWNKLLLTIESHDQIYDLINQKKINNIQMREELKNIELSKFHWL